MKTQHTPFAAHGIAAIAPDGDKRGNTGSNPGVAPFPNGHTSGEWEQRAERDGRSTVHYVKIGTGNCYMSRGVGQTEDEVRANARLIAAAPDLLTAAKNAAELLARIPAFGDTIGTEINKAQCGIALRQLKQAIGAATS